MGDEHQDIQHFSHQHPLMFKEELERKYNDRIGHPPVFCDGCGDQVFGPSYSCHQCPSNKLFILHKSCAELPHEIHHPIHSNHPLVLFLTSITEGSRGQNNNIHCDACEQDCKGSFIYHCLQCDFNLDLKCASNWRNIIESSSHDHNFIVLKKPKANYVACEVCGKDDTVAVDLHFCSICQLLLHKVCSWLPNHVEIPSHQHSLKLTWYFEDIYPNGEENFCQICFRSMDKSRAIYCCHEEGCTFVAHNTCAIPSKTTSDEDDDDSDDDDDDDDNDDNDDDDEPPQVDNKQMQLEEVLPKIINKYDHSLSLTNISNVDGEKTIICDGCMLPISLTDAWFYSCTSQDKDQEEKDCHFFLHKTCAQLPSRKNYSFHKHELTLVSRASNEIDMDDGVFTCEMCHSFCQGFAYHCRQCKLYFDIGCTNLSDNQRFLHQEVHTDHPLYFSQQVYKQCSACGKYRLNSYWFSCNRCNFHLCILCVKLPPTARHWHHNHRLKLSYHTTTSVENKLEFDDNDDDQYYCEICEGKLDATHWLYSCKDCDFHCHPHCILGIYPQVKVGGSYKLNSHPQHLVTLVEKRRSPIPSDKRENILPCQVCGYPCEGLVLECSICNIDIHHDCKYKGVMFAPLKPKHFVHKPVLF